MTLRIEYLSPSEINQYGRNARMHSDDQVSQIVASIEEFGFTTPVLIDSENVLIAGHGRLAAAEQLGMDKVPAIRLAGLTPNQVKALRIADNQLALNATWDLDLLSAELSDLESADFDIDLMGFDEDFLKGLLSDDDDIGTGEQPDNDDQPAATEKVELLIGPYKVSVTRAEWDRWETAVRAKAGFEVKDVTAEIKRRLGF